MSLFKVNNSSYKAIRIGQNRNMNIRNLILDLRLDRCIFQGDVTCGLNSQNRKVPVKTLIHLFFYDYHLAGWQTRLCSWVLSCTWYSCGSSSAYFCRLQTATASWSCLQVSCRGEARTVSQYGITGCRLKQERQVQHEKSEAALALDVPVL